MTNPRMTKILNYLRAEGYAANVESDETIAFKYNRIAMFAGTENGDDEYYKVYLISSLYPHQSKRPSGRARILI